MRRFLCAIPVLSLAAVFGQEASNIFEKAPPDVDEALRARITQFYQAFVQGKFRLADSFVAEDSKDVFFAMEKKQYKACEVGTIRYSQEFTKAVAVTSCDSKYFMLGREVPVKLPITSAWRLEDGVWYWYVLPQSERTTYDTPVGPARRPPTPKPGEEEAAAPAVQPPPRPDPVLLMKQIDKAVEVDRDTLEIHPTKASSAEVHVKSSMPGVVTITSDPGGIAGLHIKPAKQDIEAGGEAKFEISFDPNDPSIVCSECLSHPQTRIAGTVKLRVDQTGKTFPIQIVYITPAPAK